MSNDGGVQGRPTEARGRIRRFGSVYELPGEVFAASGPSYYQSRAAFELAEQTNPGEIAYIGTASGGRSLVVPTIVGSQSSRWVMGRTDRLYERAVAMGASPDLGAVLERPAQLLPSLVCGGRQMGFSAPVSSYIGSEHQPEYVSDLRVVTVALEQEAVELGCASVSWPFVADAVTREALREAGYHEYNSGVWHSLDSTEALAGYLHRLSGRRRRTVLAERSKLHARGYKSEGLIVDDALIEPLAALEHETLTGHGVPWTPDISASLLRQTLLKFPRRVVASVVRRGGSMVAFCVFICSGGALWPRHVGVRKSDAFSVQALSESMFRRSVIMANSMGCDRVHLGFGSDAYKRINGAAGADHFSLTKLV